jgi:GNAT superfamily N-acetyltransferase
VAVVIREVGAGDWRLLRDVRLRALADAPYAFLTTHEQASRRSDAEWREWAAPDDHGTAFVADAGGRFDGMVAAFVADDPATVHLVAMWVDPAARGTGVAGELVEAVVGWARDRGAARVALNVEAGNDRALRLYERCGFTVPAEPPVLPYSPHEGSTTMVRAT